MHNRTNILFILQANYLSSWTEVIGSSVVLSNSQRNSFNERVFCITTQSIDFDHHLSQTPKTVEAVWNAACLVIPFSSGDFPILSLFSSLTLSIKALPASAFNGYTMSSLQSLFIFRICDAFVGATRITSVLKYSC